MNELLLTDKKMRNNRLICMFIILLIGTFVSIILDISDTFYDASWYWKIADSVYIDKTLSSFPKSTRGCLLPIFFSGIKYFTIALNGSFDPLIVCKVFTNLFVSIEFAILLPIVFDIEYKLVGIVRIVLSYLLFLYFYANFLQYPLSDFYATFFLTLTLALYKRALTKHSVVPWCWWVGVGLTLYITYNIRTVYVYFFIPFSIFFTIVNQKKKNIKYLSLMLIGAFLASTPQIIVNYNLYNKITPLIYTTGYNGIEQRLEVFHIYTGLKIDRYETYIGDKKYYGRADVNFDDKLGTELLTKESIDLESFQLRDLLFLMFNYPIEMISIYSKHLVNLVLPLYNKVYVTNLFFNKTLNVIIAMIVFLVCLFHIMCNSFKKNIFATMLCIALIFPSILQALGAVEYRFGITLHIVFAYSIFNIVSYKRVIGFVKKNVVLSLTLVILVTMLFAIVSTDTMMSLRNAPTFIAG